jgi:hypothetical protein
MGEAQQEQELQANKRRKQSPQLRVDDKVWLKLGDHYKAKRPSRKLGVCSVAPFNTSVLLPK